MVSASERAKLEERSARLQRLSRKRFGVVRVVFLQNPMSTVGVALVVALLLVAALGPLIAPYDPSDTNPRVRMSPPSASHPFGTDSYGRDVLSRVLAAARVDLTIAVVAISIALVIGTTIGALTGYFGGWLDMVVMRVLDALQSFPQFILAMGLAAAMGPGVRNLIVVIAIVMTPGSARIMRSRIISLREMPFVDAARIARVPTWRIISAHLVPNGIGPVIVHAALALSFAMLDAAGLSFIGLGVRPPQAEWGTMISEGVGNLLAGEWWVSVFAGLALFVSVLGFNLFGDGLRDILDPRMRR